MKIYRDTVLKRRLGFTLIEMLVVVAIIGVLVSIVMFNLQGTLVRGKMLGTKGQLNALNLAIETYKSDVGIYPPRDLLIESLTKGLGANLRWKGPYYTFEEGQTASIVNGDLLDRSASSRLGYHGNLGGDALQDLFPLNVEVYLDQFERPFVYVPARDYRIGLGVQDENETFYNSTTFQLFSFGPDGLSAELSPGSLIYDDGINNDLELGISSDDLTDGEDNLKSSKTDGLIVEDDIGNW